jgi:BMFP domain-containing protein YqiC
MNSFLAQFTGIAPRRTHPQDSEMADSSNRPNLDDLARRLTEAVPQNLKAMGEDLERNFKSLLQTGLERMDLVTREEFDVQVAVLARTREKLEALEARLAEMQETPSA